MWELIEMVLIISTAASAGACTVGLLFYLLGGLIIRKRRERDQKMICEYVDYIDSEFDKYYVYCTVKKTIVDAKDCGKSCEARKNALLEKGEEDEL